MLSNIVNTTLEQSNQEALLDTESHAIPEDLDEDVYDAFDDLNTNYYQAVAVDEHDNIYTVHNPSGTAILTKRDPNGDVVYIQDISTILDEYSLVYCITPDFQGSLYLVGARVKHLHTEPAIYKYTTDGKLLWRRYKETKDDGRFICSTYVNNRIYAIGFLPSKTNSDVEAPYIAAYNSVGKLICSNSKSLLPGNANYRIMDIQHDSEGNIYIAGSTENLETKNTEAYITKLTPTLSFIQHETYYHSYITCYTSLLLINDVLYASANISDDDSTTFKTTFLNKYEYDFELQHIFTTPDTPTVNMVALKKNGEYVYIVGITNNSILPSMVRLDPQPQISIQIPDIIGYGFTSLNPD